MTRKKVTKRKLEIVFDPKKRREFLSGFQKRKNERRKRAKEELERNVKEERKRIRQEIKNDIKHMKKSFEPLKELTEEDKAVEEEYQDDDVKVKIVEISTNELAARNNLLGENRAADTTNSVSESEEAEEDDAHSEVDANCIPGMDLKANATTRTKNDENPGPGKKNKELKDKKELDRLKKNRILKKLKTSKVLKQKERFQKVANQKKAKRDKNNTLRSLPKNQRKKKRLEPSRYNKGRLINKKRLGRKRND